MEHRIHDISKAVLVGTILLLILCLMGCAKSASQTATDAALAQVNVVEQTIKKECPQAKIDKDMDALRADIKAQLRTCEAEQARIQADKVKWEVAFFALLVIIGVWFAGRVIK